MVVSTFSYFFPTTVVFIDDDISFVNALTNKIENGKSFIVSKHYDPLNTLEMINSISCSNSFGHFEVAGNKDDDPDQESVAFDISKLHREVYNRDRFSKISVVVVDYMMPEIDGITFCSKIADKNIQRILLTGVSDVKIAIKAFNEGQINRFIRKATENLVEEITESINKSINRYFSVQTAEVARHLCAYEYSHLKDPIFADFFFKSYFSERCAEYYMLDTYGSYMFLDSGGHATLLSIMSENELNRITQFAIESGIATRDVLKKLQSRKFLLAIHRQNGQLPSVIEWHKYLKPANRIDCYQTYYFAIFDDDALDIEFNKIINFDSFKQAHNMLG
ncbi:MAG: response regulator [Holosporaceae bacterium]|jgi:CheY-like chemotaxis protein|nr:response regulator [Holosporaceae bacterium]